MTQIDPAPEDILRQQQEQVECITTEELVRRYGKPRYIEDIKEAWQLVRAGKESHLFCTTYNNQNQIEADHGKPGMHIVHVMDRYYFDVPLGNIYVKDVNYRVLNGE